MPTLRINDVNIEFPFEPYECQKAYMEAVLRSLQQEQNAILESPTGTGKTLCLLCASLAWLETVKARFQGEQIVRGDVPLSQYAEQLTAWLSAGAGASSNRASGLLPLAPPKIIYASRTHSQLSQVMAELKRTAYRSVKMAVMGSRDQLCINPAVMQEKSNAAKVNACRAKVSTRTCIYYNNVDTKKSASDFTRAADDGSRVLDIEDLNKLGSKHRCCPYYLARSMAKDSADIIFMPYNYLLDPAARKMNGIELQGNVVIFDEAHNLEQICEDSASLDLSSVDLAAAIGEVSAVLEFLVEQAKSELQLPDSFAEESSKASEGLQIDAVARIKAMLIHLEEEIDKIELKNGERVEEGSFMFELLDRVNLSFATYEAVHKVLDDIILFLSNEGMGIIHSKGTGVNKVANLVKIVFNGAPRESQMAASYQARLSQYYKVFIQDAANKKQKIGKSTWLSKAGADDAKADRVLSYWCFSPGYTMLDLQKQGVKCVILTSGTLRPLSSFSAEMRIPFPIKLENPHVIARDQILLGVITKGPDGMYLNSSYDTRSDPAYQASLGNTIVNFARLVPSGLLVFFPSYFLMQDCIETWKRKNIWDRIQQHKAVFVEPKVKEEFATAIDEFYKNVNSATANGAIFIGVCRGKVSEGLDFADANGRAVIITGLPYAPRKDPRIVLKMQYLDQRSAKERNSTIKLLSGNEWYQQQASRAINQAVGRVIRHKNDYGAILLCDKRFATTSQIEQLPPWLKVEVRTCDTFGQIVRDLTAFFKSAEAKYPCASKPSVCGDGRKPIKQQAAPARCADAMFEPDLTSRKVAMPPPSSGKSVAAMLSSASNQLPRTVRNGDISHMYTGPGVSFAKENDQKFSLLDALSEADAVKEKLDYDCTYVALHELSSASSPSASQQPAAKRRRITIKGKKELPVAALYESENLVGQVKGCLSAEDFKRYSRAVVQYRFNGNLSDLLAVFADLFIARPDQHDFILRFYPYVRPHQREEFDSHCMNLTGKTFKPASARAPAVHSRPCAAGSGGKAASTGSNPASTAASSRSVAGNASAALPASKSDPFLRPTAVSRSSEPAAGPPVRTAAAADDPRKQHGRATGGGSATSPALAVCRNAPVAARGASSVCSEATDGPGLLSGRTHAVSPDLLSDPGSPSVVLSDDDDVAPVTSQAQTPPASAPAGMQPSSGTRSSDAAATLPSTNCPLCLSALKLPLYARCGHVCCIRCWIAHLRDQKTCPVCGVAVRKRDLLPSTMTG